MTAICVEVGRLDSAATLSCGRSYLWDTDGAGVWARFALTLLLEYCTGTDVVLVIDTLAADDWYSEFCASNRIPARVQQLAPGSDRLVICPDGDDQAQALLSALIDDRAWTTDGFLTISAHGSVIRPATDGNWLEWLGSSDGIGRVESAIRSAAEIHHVEPGHVTRPIVTWRRGQPGVHSSLSCAEQYLNGTRGRADDCLTFDREGRVLDLRTSPAYMGSRKVIRPLTPDSSFAEYLRRRLLVQAGGGVRHLRHADLETLIGLLPGGEGRLAPVMRTGPTAPIVVCGPNDVFALSPDHNPDPVRVETGAYLAFDREGRLLELEVAQDRLITRPATAGSSFAPQLRFLLLTWLRQAGAADGLDRSDLCVLIETVKDIGGTRRGKGRG